MDSDGNGADIGLVIVGGQMKVQVKGIGSVKVGNFNMGIRWQHLTIVVNTIGRGCVGAHPKVSDQTSELFELPPPPSRCSFPLSGIGHDYLESSRLSLASDISCPCQVSGPLSWS